MTRSASIIWNKKRVICATTFTHRDCTINMQPMSLVHARSPLRCKSCPGRIYLLTQQTGTLWLGPALFLCSYHSPVWLLPSATCTGAFAHSPLTQLLIWVCCARLGEFPPNANILICRTAREVAYPAAWRLCRQMKSLTSVRMRRMARLCGDAYTPSAPASRASVKI